MAPWAGRALAAALGALGALRAVPAAAKMIEDGGYKYYQISLSGLWGGFFVFLLGIVFCLIGLFLFVLWRRAPKDTGVAPAPKGAEEEETQVF